MPVPWNAAKDDADHRHCNRLDAPQAQKGEFYYWILYYAYLSPQQCENAGAILQSLESKGISISLRTYYVHRDEAIEVLSSILWGYTSQDCEKITNLLTPD